jgi:radical SAM protein with 4Fe4S-binding SPASM domain
MNLLPILESKGRGDSMSIFSKDVPDIMSVYFQHPVWKMKPGETIPDMPLDVQLELINRCNLKCDACPIHKNSRNRTLLSWDVLKKIADEIAKESICYVTICGIGEAALHPDLFKFTRYIRDLEVVPNGMRKLSMIPTVLISNVMWTKNQVNDCIMNPPDLLSASVAGLSDKEIVERRSPIDILGFYENLKYIHDNRHVIRKEDGGISPNIHISTHIYPHEMETRKEEIEIFKEKWLKVCDSVVIKPTMLDQHHLEFDEFMKPSNLQYTDITTTKFERTAPCLETSRRLSVNSDGDIWCGHHNSEDFGDLLGNVYDNSLRDIWHSETMNDFRKEVRAGIFNREGCKSCGGEIRDFHRSVQEMESEIKFGAW